LLSGEVADRSSQIIATEAGRDIRRRPMSVRDVALYEERLWHPAGGAGHREP
jgi:hypothetical protein